MSMKTYSGGCHCGAVHFEADLDLAAGTTRCNCTLCAKARAWFAFAKGPEAFRLIKGGDALTEYRWTPPGRSSPGLTYAFCRTCGVRAFARGTLEMLGGTFHAVPVATLEDVSAEDRARAPINYTNGLHDHQDLPLDDTRWL